MVTCCDYFPPRRPHSVLQRPSRPYLAAPSRIHWVSPFLDAKLNVLMVTQCYYIEDAPVANPGGKTGRGNREVDNRPPRSSSERKIPAPIQYIQVIPGDHFSDQDSPPVQTGFSPLGRLTIKFARNKGPPTSLFEAFLKEEDLGPKISKGSLGEK